VPHPPYYIFTLIHGKFPVNLRALFQVISAAFGQKALTPFFYPPIPLIARPADNICISTQKTEYLRASHSAKINKFAV